jgi:indole-3-glycerol phosphate synthase
MATLLDRILETKRREIAEAEIRTPRGELENAITLRPPARDWETALRKPNASAPLRLIAEMKKASPSAGLIRADYRPADIAAEYERLGANAISVLTDKTFFQGSLDDLAAASAATKLPVLRKDFIVNDYQLLEARAAGADAVLLIARILAGKRLSALLDKARAIGLATLVETRTADEIQQALDAGAKVIGINHRDLDTLTMDLSLSERLRPLIPKGVIVVAESGIKTAEDVKRLKAAGVDAILVGETLLKSQNNVETIKSLRLQNPA